MGLTTLLVFILAAPVCVPAGTDDRSAQQSRHNAEIEASVVPVHPGIPGSKPFWNRYAKRFIYAPAFDIAPVDHTAPFRFTAVSDADGEEHVFEAEHPWVPLNPLWKELPPGRITLRVTSEGTPTGTLVDERTFLKSTPFSGVIPPPAYDYAESGLRCLEALFRQPTFQTWLTHGRPDSTYPLWVHPTKLMGAVVAGMTAYAGLVNNPDTASQAITIARTAADFLLQMREPAGTPFEYWPPTYWDGVPRDIHPVYQKQLMTHYPAEGAMAFLDLYDVTKEERYMDAAVRIADTYVKTQLQEGTWPQLVDRKSGSAASTHRLIPTYVIRFFDRLRHAYGLQQYHESRQAAFAWCMHNPMITYDWHAQFEDTRPKPLYKNLSRREAVEMAILLFADSTAGEDRGAQAEELLRFAEDQFVVWDSTDPAWRERWFREGAVWEHNTPSGGKDWFLPCVMEQYVFFTPIASSSGLMITGYLSAYRETRKPLYHAKAVALANTLTRAQKFHGGGEIPTYLREHLPDWNWINVSVWSALTLITHAEELREEAHD